MARESRQAFTLIELIIVIVLMGLLIALLVPVVHSVWQTGLMTKCAHQLRQLGVAQGVYRAEHEWQFATGVAWPRLLMPYVENVGAIFECPAVTAGTAVTERSERDTVGMNEFSFRFYDQQGGFIFELLVDESMAAVRRTDLGERGYALGVEDYYILELEPPNPNWTGTVPEGYLWEKDPFGQGGWDDIGFTIHMQDGIPVEAEVWGESEELLYHCRADFYINGDLILTDAWENRGTTVPIDQSLSILCDYGLSVGSYGQSGQRVVAPDSTLFFILDYPKPLADYNRLGREDEWDKYFILRPDEWDYGDEVSEGETWRCYQSLRHLGRANVLFCDGHVETLGVSTENATLDEVRVGKYLDETSPLWRHNSW